MARYFVTVTDIRRDRRTTIGVNAVCLEQAKALAIAHCYPGSCDMPHQRSNLQAVASELL